MGAITGTLIGDTEFGGEHKLITVTAPVAATSDTITLTAADHAGAVSIVAIVGATITGGIDANYSMIQASFSGLIVTIVSLLATGAAADDFTGTTVEIALLIKTTA